MQPVRWQAPQSFAHDLQSSSALHLSSPQVSHSPQSSSQFWHDSPASQVPLPHVLHAPQSAWQESHVSVSSQAPLPQVWQAPQSATHVVQSSPDSAEQAPSPQVEQAPQSCSHDSHDSSPEAFSQAPLPQTGHAPQSWGQVSQTSSSSWTQTPSPQLSVPGGGEVPVAVDVGVAPPVPLPDALPLPAAPAWLVPAEPPLLPPLPPRGRPVPVSLSVVVPASPPQPADGPPRITTQAAASAAPARTAVALGRRLESEGTIRTGSHHPLGRARRRANEGAKCSCIARRADSQVYENGGNQKGKRRLPSGRKPKGETPFVSPNRLGRDVRSVPISPCRCRS
jgi:hypothetical protein